MTGRASKQVPTVTDGAPATCLGGDLRTDLWTTATVKGMQRVMNRKSLLRRRIRWRMQRIITVTATLIMIASVGVERLLLRYSSRRAFPLTQYCVYLKCSIHKAGIAHP